jgi:hypothetical protein
MWADFVFGIALIGFLVWVLLTYVPMPPPIKLAIVVLVVVWIVLRAAPLLGLRLP